MGFVFGISICQGKNMYTHSHTYIVLVSKLNGLYAVVVLLHCTHSVNQLEVDVIKKTKCVYYKGFLIYSLDKMTAVPINLMDMKDICIK